MAALISSRNKFTSTFLLTQPSQKIARPILSSNNCFKMLLSPSSPTGLRHAQKISGTTVILTNNLHRSKSPLNSRRLKTSHKVKTSKHP